MKVYIRWMGYITHTRDHISLKKSIAFEMSRKDEAACEPVKGRSGIANKNVCVGLLLKNSAIFREFYGDCWSYYGKDRNKCSKATPQQSPSRLYANRPRKTSAYGEAFAKMDGAIEGIVVFGGLAEVPRAVADSVTASATKYNLPVYTLTRNGRLILS